MAGAGPLRAGGDRATAEDLAELLGMPISEAAAVAARLLDDPHPLVAAVAAGTDPAIRSEAITSWLADPVAAVERGPIPSQAAVDAWAEERTLGLIPRLPTDITPDLVLLLATAVAAVEARPDHLPGAAWSGLPVFSAWVTEPDEA